MKAGERASQKGCCGLEPVGILPALGKRSLMPGDETWSGLRFRTGVTLVAVPRGAKPCQKAGPCGPKCGGGLFLRVGRVFLLSPEGTTVEIEDLMSSSAGNFSQ